MQIELPSYLQPLKAAQPTAVQHAADTDMLACFHPGPDGNLITDLNKAAAGTTASEAARAQQMTCCTEPVPSSATTSCPASPHMSSVDLLLDSNSGFGQPVDLGHPGYAIEECERPRDADGAAFAEDDMQVTQFLFFTFTCLNSPCLLHRHPRPSNKVAYDMCEFGCSVYR